MVDPSSNYDEQRELSMADEGGAAGAQMEAEEDVGTITRAFRPPKIESDWKEIALVAGVFALASYFVIRDLRKRKPTHLRVIS